METFKEQYNWKTSNTQKPIIYRTKRRKKDKNKPCIEEVSVFIM